MDSVNKAKLRHNVGLLGEELVASWLQQQNFKMLARRWHCLWGEIDLIALELTNSDTKILPKLLFVEVKTRRSNNWDLDGLLAITPAKQVKIKHTAALFIAENPHLANCICQFDVALVKYCQEKTNQVYTSDRSSVEIGQSISIKGYSLCLQDYIQGAFDD
jgi:putative endonuclease